MGRASWEASVRVLREAGWLDDGHDPVLPERMPTPSDEVLGVSIFRARAVGLDGSGLTLPRTLFGRSEVANARLVDCDLSESNLCWNDFVDVSFAGSDLSASDLRASYYERVDFTGAKLAGADLRMSEFVDCAFEDADLTGARITEAGAAPLALSAAQRQQVRWEPDEGDEPPGG